MNAEATHSPAPWRQGESDELTIIEDAEGNLVAFVDLPGMTAQDRANFALMLAAPKLLEALKACLTWDGRFIADEAVQQARAAIAEAEGR